MKIRMDKDFVSIAQRETMKMAIADFKSHFTENDLVRMYAEEFNAEYLFYPCEVLKCEVSAFLQKDLADDASFMVDIIIRTTTKFVTLHFCIDENNGDYSINREPILREMKEYKMA